MSRFYSLAGRLSRSVRRNSWLDVAARRCIEPLLHRLYDSEGLKWSINGIPCRIDPRFRAQMHPEYDAQLAALLRNRFRPGQIALDVGANIGAWVIQLANAVGPEGKVVAFEPNASAREVLEKHVRLNHLEQLVQIVPAAVGSQVGDVELFTAGADGLSRVGEANPLNAASARPVNVAMVTLDKWCEENNVQPNWLFIDIEGFEAHALTGARDVIRNAGPLLEIVIEMHPSLWPASGTSSTEIAAIFAAIGRRPVAVSGQTDIYADYGHVILEPINQHEQTS